MARESRPLDATPRAASADPISNFRRSLIQTPGSQRRPLGLSASGRKIAPPTATPHARAAFRTIDSRRAAIFTPHRARRKSVREARDSPRDLLLGLGRVLAKKTEPIVTSSSSPGDTPNTSRSDDDSHETTLGPLHMSYDDDDEADLPKRPRLSLPIDREDDSGSDDLVPHRSILLDNEDNFTMQSVEMPRRAYSEGPGGRLSMNSTRMSDFFNTNDMLHSEDFGRESGMFPPINAIEEEGTFTMADIMSPERLESDAGRRETGHESDFGIHVPVDIDDQTSFVINPEVQSSPVRQPADLDEPVYEDFAPMEDARSDSYDGGVDDGPDDFGDVGNLPDMEDEDLDNAANETTRMDTGNITETEVLTHAQRAELRAAAAARKKRINISKHGIQYPSLPPAVVKRLAQNFAKTSGAKGKITPDAMNAIMQASDWFFEQLGEDLEAYSKHAGRNTINESDVITLMRRQRHINSQTTPFALASRYLPRELLQDLRMPPPVLSKIRRKTGEEAAPEAEEDESVT
ncbi:centromere kinetochore component CENP-T-domain-containing protein [Triangularia verruculosa]|uniref:Centromere kinetochore component CENP-T-domain-containing protein n=1 Tax=Triangularia verruculosa TaxID=2587418 RepID=A0AAN6XFQ7_9PEZI|nr:centromere kinetochore component CENP-T-domain-containing protein [Triangularia verruculosa]